MGNKVFTAVDITEDAVHATVTRFAGFSVHESVGSAVVRVEFKITNNSGQLIWVVELASGGSESIMFDGYFAAASGIWVQHTGTGVPLGVLIQAPLNEI